MAQVPNYDLMSLPEPHGKTSVLCHFVLFPFQLLLYYITQNLNPKALR